MEKYLGTRETAVVSNPTKLVICSLKIWVRVMDWIELAQDRDKLWAHVNVIMNLWAHKMQGIA